MKIGGIQFPVFKPYIKPAIEIYISGCNMDCSDCQNPELQDFHFGNTIDINKLIEYLAVRREMYDIISIVGGDLLSQPASEAVQLIFLLTNTFLDKEFWLFTGKDRKEVQDWVWSYFDYVKVGKYDKLLQQKGFPSSSNQKLLKKGIDY